MPQVAAQEAYSWKPSLMTGFLEKFLTFIRDVMAKVEDVAYVFEWNAIDVECGGMDIE